MGELLAFGGEARRWLWLVGLIMARLTPIFQIVPFLGGRHLTGMVRNSLALALGLFLAPGFSGLAGNAPDGLAAALPLLVKEVTLGILFGFLSSLAFYVASGLGFLVDNQRGMSMAQTEDPLSGEQTSPLGALFLETLVMVFIAAGGLVMFFQAILTTYAFWPPFSFWPDWSGGSLKLLLLGQFSWYLATMTALAAPMLLVCFLVDFGMGLMNRFAPQLNVFFLAMPVKSGLVMAMMSVYWLAMFKALGSGVFRLPVLWDALRRALAA